ncbi:MAG: cytochrome b5 domain-containing protein [Erysipelotrichaceae bacterium]
MKKIVALMMILLLTGCASNSPTEPKQDAPTQDKTQTGELSKLIEITLEELKAFNGLETQPAYIAVDGQVYDVSAIFTNGEHHGMKAGADLSSAFHDEHSIDKLKLAKHVGYLPGNKPTSLNPSANKEQTALLDELATNNKEELKNDQAQDDLKLAYNKGEIDKETYQTKKAALEKEEQVLDAKEDKIEQQLKAAGYQDKDDHDDEDDD